MLSNAKTLVWMVGLALKRASIRGLRKALTEEEIRRVAETIVHELESHNWKISLGEPGRPPG